MGALSLVLWSLASLHIASSLTCYNGMKLMRGQSVGQQTEECPSGASCYNMTSSAAFVVDVVKAGCSTWRCMMAKDRCIGININFVPVSLCCCSHDRCNVAGNAQYSSGGMGGGGSSYGGGGYGGGGQGGNGGGYGGNSNNNNNNGGGSAYGGGGYGGYGSGGYGGNNNNNNNNNNGGGSAYGGGGYGGNNNNNNGGGGSAYGGGGYGGGGYGGDQAGKISIGSDNAANPSAGNKKKPSLTKDQIESAFKNFDVDNKQHGTANGDVEEESFSMVDVTKTTPRPRGPAPPPSGGSKVNL